MNFVHSASPTADGGFLLADTLNGRIRKISAAGVITTVAGTGDPGYSGDGGPATSAQINNPRGVVALADGGFLIPDSNNHRVRKVSPAGMITTVAGTGAQGFSGDGGPATAAQLSIPFGVAPTADGGFLIVDVGNQRIRKVSAAGEITTVAGNGIAGYGGDDGPATAASLRDPHNVVALADGGFLIADASNQRVRRASGGRGDHDADRERRSRLHGRRGPAADAQVSVPKGIDVSSRRRRSDRGRAEQPDPVRGNRRCAGEHRATDDLGSARPGQQLAANAGGWSGTGPVIAYQWQRCSQGCVDIASATGRPTS